MDYLLTLEAFTAIGGVLHLEITVSIIEFYLTAAEKSFVKATSVPITVSPYAVSKTEHLVITEPF